MKKILISCLLTAVIVTAALVIEAGYFIGNYCVHFGLERGTAENPQDWSISACLFLKFLPSP